VEERATFGPFELDVKTGRLLKHGKALKVVGQPLEVLALLLERSGEVVTRDELRTRLWGGETFVDFEHGLNAAVNKLRFALGDSADNPRYVETLTRKGYRFIAPLETRRPSESPPVEPDPTPLPGTPRGFRPGLILAASAPIAAVLAAWMWSLWAAPASKSEAVPTDRILLVVLPFENLSNNQEQDYFAEGLTDELITRLGQLDPDRLGVIARTSAAYYSGARRRVRQIAAELGVEYVVEGGVGRAGDRVRVSARLVRAADETSLWTDSYDRDIGDLLAVQNELARAIAGRIELRLPAPARYAHQPTPEAYEAYLRGRFLLGRRTADALAKGHASLQQSVRLDPRFALAYAGLSEAYQRLAYRARSPAETMPLALDAARRSLELDPDLADGHAARALILSNYEWNWTEADREFRRALELNPNSADTRIAFAAHLSHVGRLDEAVAEVKRALQLDPVALAAHAQLAVILYRARRYDEALQQLRAMLELDPNYPVAHLNLGLVHAAQGKYTEAIAAFERARSLDAGSAELTALLAYALARSGERRQATALLAELQAKSAREFVQPFAVGLVHLGLGDHAAAVDCLERGYQERSWMTALIKVNPELDALRGDSRFEALVRRLNFPE